MKPKRNYAAERLRTGELANKGMRYWQSKAGERRTVVGGSLVALEAKLKSIENSIPTIPSRGV